MSEKDQIKIVIAEDSMTQAIRVKTMLENNDFLVFHGKNGLLAFDLVLEHKPDIVISDIVMPEMDGFTLCRNLKDDQRTMHVPVILHTTLTDVDDLFKGIDSGADSFVNKPLTEAYLVRHIQDVIASVKARPEGHAENEVTVTRNNHAYMVRSDSSRLLSLLVSSFESAIIKNKELNKAHQELNELNMSLEAKVARRTEELNVARLKAEESSRLKTAFLQNMSHEIRTPLNAILGFANMMKEETLDKEVQDEFVSDINEASKRLLNIINNILDLSLIESFQLELKLTDFNLYPVFEQRLQAFRSDALLMTRPDVELVLDVEPVSRLLRINSDQQRLGQVLDNLLNNAVKYTKKGKIEFGYRKVDHEGKPHVEVWVRDTGIGIPENKFGLMFKHFRQVEESGFHDGAGLGLAINKGILDLMDGEIWFDSVVDEGSTFYFRIPLKEETTLASGRPLGSGVTKLTGKTVVVAEPDDSIRSYLSQTLHNSGALVTEITDGYDLVKYVETEKPQLLILGMDLPGLSGMECLESLQTKGLHRNMVIIGHAKRVNEFERNRCLGQGCQGYIAMPYSRTELFGMIIYLMRKQSM